MRAVLVAEHEREVVHRGLTQACEVGWNAPCGLWLVAFWLENERGTNLSSGIGVCPAHDATEEGGADRWIGQQGGVGGVEREIGDHAEVAALVSFEDDETPYAQTLDGSRVEEPNAEPLAEPSVGHDTEKRVVVDSVGDVGVVLAVEAHDPRPFAF